METNKENYKIGIDPYAADKSESTIVIINGKDKSNRKHVAHYYSVLNKMLNVLTNNHESSNDSNIS